MSKNTIFSDTHPFSKTKALALKQEIDNHLSKLGIGSVMVGSAINPNNPTPSNDLDLQVDLQSVTSYFLAADSKKARIALADYFRQQGFETKRNGINVFVRVPLDGVAHQVDLEVVDNVTEVSRYHMHKIPIGSPFKGVSKQLLIMCLAKDNGFMYAPWDGLFIRTADNKKGELYAINWDDIAQILLGPKATGTDLDCVENILAKLSLGKQQSLLERCRQDKNWFEDNSLKMG